MVDLDDNLLEEDETLTKVIRESLVEDNKKLEKDLSQNIEVLKDMGYEESFIRKIYMFAKPRSLEQAIDYMTLDNGKYNHNFIPDTKNSIGDLCYICGQPGNCHNNFIEDNSSNLLRKTFENFSNRLSYGSLKNSTNNSERELNIKENYKNEKICEICICEYDPNENKIKLPCNHEYCFQCWLHYLVSKIENGNVENIHCMHFKCETILSKEFIMSYIENDNELVKKYEKFLKKMELLKNKNIKFCPFPDCDGYAEKKKDKFVTCTNGHKFCFDCLREWHKKSNCKDAVDDTFKLWKQGKIIKQCPNCKMYTEKNEGCNHMTCAECHFQWCWLCGGDYSSNHFNSGKCKGLQFYKPKNEEEIENKLKENAKLYKEPILETMFFGFCYILLYLFISPFIITIGKVLDTLDGIHEPYVAFAIGFTQFICGVMYLICYEMFTIFFLIIIGIPALVYWPYLNWLKRKWKLHVLYSIH